MTKKLFISLVLLLAAPLLWAQGKVSTRSYRLADFTDKVTKVVLTEDALLANALQQEVVAAWTASAFELCTLEQFEQLKTSDRYYFLMVLESSGISSLTLLKGGPEAAKGIGAMFEVVSLPLVASLGGTGREYTFLGGLVKTVQEYTLDAMDSEKAAYGMEHWVNRNYAKQARKKDILITRADLAPSVGEKDLSRLAGTNLQVVETDVADGAYLDILPGTLVGYVVAPVFPEKGSFCYKMLFEADTHSLIYLDKHRIDAAKGVGFLPEDLRKLSHRKR